MKQYVILSLLFFTFIANAIESSMMMASMAPDQGMSMPMDHGNGTSDHHASDAPKDSGKARLAGTENITCDENAACGACLIHSTCIILQIDVPSISVLDLIRLKSDYSPSEISNDYTLLLRPPRLP